jgi:hypothetical protein
VVLGKKVRPYVKNDYTKQRAGGTAEVVEHLYSTNEAMSSNSSTAKTTKDLVKKVKFVVVKSKKPVKGCYQFNIIISYVMRVAVIIMATDYMLFIKCQEILKELTKLTPHNDALMRIPLLHF